LIKRVQAKHAPAETSKGAGSAGDAELGDAECEPTNKVSSTVETNEVTAETSGGAGSATDAVETNKAAAETSGGAQRSKTSLSTTSAAGSAGDAVNVGEVAIHIDENEHPGIKTMFPLWLWDFYDVYTFTLVGADVKAKARPESLMTVWVIFHFIYALGILVPLAHFGLKGSLRIYVVIEAAYDLMQGAVVAFLWEVEEELGESRWLRDGEGLKWTYFTICCITSTIDGVIIKFPTAVLHL
jgi:hypothetical protein